jgi:hypothetical protein
MRNAVLRFEEGRCYLSELRHQTPGAQAGEGDAAAEGRAPRQQPHEHAAVFIASFQGYFRRYFRHYLGS